LSTNSRFSRGLIASYPAAEEAGLICRYIGAQVHGQYIENLVRMLIHQLKNQILYYYCANKIVFKPGNNHCDS
jgi:hypothetical protein